MIHTDETPLAGIVIDELDMGSLSHQFTHIPRCLLRPQAAVPRGLAHHFAIDDELCRRLTHHIPTSNEKGDVGFFNLKGC